MAKKIIVGNWKMYPSLSDALVLAASLKKSLDEIRSVEVVLAPPNAWLVPVIEAYSRRGKHIHFASQNVFSEDQGAFTGEVSAYLLRNLIDYAIVGHSERRALGEDSHFVNEKVHSCLRWKIRPILCIGEHQRIFDSSHKTRSDQLRKVNDQLLTGLGGVKEADLDKVIIAYEPVWAVGTRHSATPHYAVEVINKLRDRLVHRYSKRAVFEMTFLYGGSVERSNAHDYLKYPEIGGLLLGGASVKAGEFAAICRLAASI